jgi:hypothetical protein
MLAYLHEYCTLYYLNNYGNCTGRKNMRKQNNIVRLLLFLFLLLFVAFVAAVAVYLGILY